MTLLTDIIKTQNEREDNKPPCVMPSRTISKRSHYTELRLPTTNLADNILITRMRSELKKIKYERIIIVPPILINPIRLNDDKVSLHKRFEKCIKNSWQSRKYHRQHQKRVNTNVMH